MSFLLKQNKTKLGIYRFTTLQLLSLTKRSFIWISITHDSFSLQNCSTARLHTEIGFKDCYLDELNSKWGSQHNTYKLIQKSVIQKVTTLTVNTIISGAKSKALLRQIAKNPRPQDFRIHTGLPNFERVLIDEIENVMKVEQSKILLDERDSDFR